MAQPISPSRARVRRASPEVTSASNRRRSGKSCGRGRPLSSRCSRSRPNAVRWKVPAFTPETPRDHSRVRSSSAAFRLKVVTRVRSASIDPSRARRATRSVRTLVLPAPAPATTQRRRSADSIASRCAGVRRAAPGRASQVSPLSVVATPAGYRRGARQARPSGSGRAPRRGRRPPRGAGHPGDGSTRAPGGCAEGCVWCGGRSRGRSAPS